MARELEILTRTYDLILWTAGHTAKFPRSHRYSLGTRMEQRLYDLHDDLLEAKYTRVGRAGRATRTTSPRIIQTPEILKYPQRTLG